MAREKNKTEQNIENKIGGNTVLEKVPQKRKKKIWDYNIVRLLLVLLVLAACSGIGAGYAVYEDRSDPTTYVAKYFGYFLCGKYDKMLEMVDTEGMVISADRFENLMAEQRLKCNVKSYEFGKPAVNKDGRYYVRISYVNADTGASEHLDIFLAQSKNIVTNAFTGWKISIADYIANDLVVAVPKDMELTIDGMKIDDSNSEIKQDSMNVISNEEGQTQVIEDGENKTSVMNIYRINNILIGQHKFKAKGAYTEILKNQDIDNNNYNVILDEKDITVSSTYRTKVKETTENFLDEFYKLVQNKKTDVKTLKPYLNDDKELREKLKDFLQKEIDRVYWPDTRYIEDYTLKKMSFGKINITTEYLGNNEFRATCKYSFDYECTTDVAVYNSYIDSISGSCKVEMKIKYTYDGDNMTINSVVKTTEENKNE